MRLVLTCFILRFDKRGVAGDDSRLMIFLVSRFYRGIVEGFVGGEIDMEVNQGGGLKDW